MIKSLKLFYFALSQGGLELDATGYTRLAEVTALDGSIAVTLAGHQAIGLKVQRNLHNKMLDLMLLDMWHLVVLWMTLKITREIQPYLLKQFYCF